jgi:nucleotide-binding universal stress UspA family protein
LETFNVKNIVVAVDFSKYSKLVLRQALALMKKLKADLHVIYIIEDIEFIGLPEAYTNAFRYSPPEPEEIKAKLVKFYKLEESDNIRITIKSGEVAKNVITLADRVEPSLIVVGSTGKSLFSRYILGSHAETIALTAKQPVWVHRGSKIRHFKHMLLPVDLSEASQKVIEVFKKTGQKSNFILNYIYVQTEQLPLFNFEVYAATLKMFKAMTQKILKSFASVNPGQKLKVVRGDVVNEIASRAKNYDLIVMSPHNKHGFFKTLGRTTAKVIRVSPVPVLIVKAT